MSRCNQFVFIICLFGNKESYARLRSNIGIACGVRRKRSRVPDGSFFFDRLGHEVSRYLFLTGGLTVGDGAGRMTVEVDTDEQGVLEI